MSSRHLASIADLDEAAITQVLDAAETRTNDRPLDGMVVALLFFEPSTRTQMSFSAAVQRLGGSVIGFQDAQSSSASKGESLEDTIRVCSGYADAIVLRHPEVGAAKRAAEVATVPVVNAGDGSNEHPTQTLLDLFTIRQRHGRLDNLSVCFAGDLLYGRTVHSLAWALAAKGNRLWFVASTGLQLPDEYLHSLEEWGSSIRQEASLEAVIADADVLYMTRVQKERMSEAEVAPVRLTPQLMEQATSTMSVMHPLPRNEEIDPAIDSDPRAAYFQQAAAGVPVRMAVLRYLLAAN